MPMFRIEQHGDFNKFERWLHRALRKDYLNIIADHANAGLDALEKATPEDSGKTAQSWRYEIIPGRGKTILSFINDNVNDGCNVAILLIYGHGTKEGAYVEGEDFVSPAIRPVFRSMAKQIWKEVWK